MILDFVMTATCRPLIVQKTLVSFTSNMLNLDFKKSVLYLNVDPLPRGCVREKVVNVCKCFFGEVIYRMPSSPNLSDAQRWCFSNTTNNLVFNLQDDWKLLRKVNMDKMSKSLLDKNSKNEKIVQCRLPFKTNMNRSKIFLSPSLMMGQFCRMAAESMRANINPEIQLKKYGKGRSILYPNKKESIVKDIGRSWMKKRGFYRSMTGPGRIRFVTWKHK